MVVATGHTREPVVRGRRRHPAVLFGTRLTTVIGGLAVQRWGEPRQTRDVDLSLLSGLGGEARFVDPLLDAYRPRMTEARQFALERRVVLVETIEGVPLDITLAGLPFDDAIIRLQASR